MSNSKLREICNNSIEEFCEKDDELCFSSDEYPMNLEQSRKLSLFTLRKYSYYVKSIIQEHIENGDSPEIKNAYRELYSELFH